MQAIERETERPKHLQVLAPPKLLQVIDRAAERTFSSRSEYVRRAIMRCLQADGLMRSDDLASLQGET